MCTSVTHVSLHLSRNIDIVFSPQHIQGTCCVSYSPFKARDTNLGEFSVQLLFKDLRKKLVAVPSWAIEKVFNFFILLICVLV